MGRAFSHNGAEKKQGESRRFEVEEFQIAVQIQESFDSDNWES